MKHGNEYDIFLKINSKTRRDIKIIESNCSERALKHLNEFIYRYN